MQRAGEAEEQNKKDIEVDRNGNERLLLQLEEMKIMFGKENLYPPAEEKVLNDPLDDLFDDDLLKDTAAATMQREKRPTEYNSRRNKKKE